MELANFVRVRVEVDGKSRAGTGSLISRNQVLTARHVVRRADLAKVEYDDNEDGGVGATQADIPWRGQGDCDAALLELREPVSFEVRPPRLEPEPLRTATPWQSRGWALAAAPEARVQDSMVDLHGEASAFLPSQKRSQLTITQKPVRIDLWQGISGAPVFENSSRGRLLGIVASTPTNFENLLSATPWTSVLAAGGPELLEQLGGEGGKERLRHLNEKLIEALKIEDAAEMIAERQDSWREAFRDGGVHALATSLLATGVKDVLIETTRAHADATRGSTKTAAAIEDVIQALVTLLVVRGHLHVLSEPASGGLLLELKVHTMTYAELVLAGFEGRPPEWAPVQGGFPRGRRRMPLPVEETGFDIQGSDLVEKYVGYLEKAYLSSDERSFAESVRTDPDRGPRKAREWVLSQVDEALELEAHLARWPGRRYLLYDPSFARENPVFFQEVVSKLPSIHRIELQGEDPASETLICRILARFLQNEHADEEETS